MKNTWTPTITSVAARIVSRSCARLPSPLAIHCADDDAAEHERRRGQAAAEQEAVLESELGDAALEPRIAVARWLTA